MARCLGGKECGLIVLVVVPLSETFCSRVAVEGKNHVTREDGDSFYYELDLGVPGEETMHLTAKGTLKDGRMVRVDPIDPARYSELVEHSR